MEICGISMACDGSCVVLPQYKIVFDCGRIHDDLLPELLRCRTFCISHGHVDHIGALHFDGFLRRRKNGNSVSYLMPPECAETWKRIYEGFGTLNEGSGCEVSVVQIREGHYPVSKGIDIHRLRTIHRVESFGYVLTTTHSKLKEHLRGKSNQEIKALKQSGEEIVESKKVALFGYTGDTTIEGVLQHKLFLEAEVLMIECTYLGDDTDPATAKARGHIHFDDIVANGEKFHNKAIVLCHFSPRYSRDYVLRHVKTLDASLRERLYVFGL